MWTFGTFELPRDIVAFSRQVRPFRSLLGILLEPQVPLFIRERPPLEASKMDSPRLHVLRFRHHPTVELQPAGRLAAFRSRRLPTDLEVQFQ
jgi:hypothetical protein